MFLFLVLFVVILNICTSQTSTGTIFFFNKQVDSDCWSQEDLAKLQARRILNQLIPKQTLEPDRISKTFVNDALRYYRRTLHAVEKQRHSASKTVLQDALADTIGGHLKSEVLPAVRLAYYAGYVSYKPVRGLHDLYSEIKTTLNTEGRGWKSPPKFPQIANLTVAKIVIGRGKLFDPCNNIVVKRDSNACIRIPIPIVDDAKDPTAVALPLKNGGLVNMLSPTSANIFLKYYTTAYRCILRKSPTTCRHSDIVKFNSDLWCWMKSDVAPHLMDEKLYAAYGGVLRVAATVQNYGKVLPRRNLFENYKYPIVEWNSWRKLTEPYFFIDSDWTPTLYIGIVILAAFAICLLQMLYNYIFGKTNMCSCVGEKQSTCQKPLHPHVMHKATKSVYYNDQRHTWCSPDSKDGNKLAQSSGKTQRVYEYNDNLLDVIMSDAEEGEYCSSESNGYDSKIENDHYEIDTKARSTSPPKIETSIEQLKINRGRVSIRGDGVEMTDKWASTEDGSSSCCDSASSGSSTSRPRTRQARPPARDLAWARQVMHSELSPVQRTRTSRTTEHTEMDTTYTTSTTQR